MSFYREQVVKRIARHKLWPKTRKRHLALFPTCAVCGNKKGLEVHHKISFRLRPDLELDPNNLKTLCRRHHFIIGHLEYWKSYNPSLEKTIMYFRKLLVTRP